jgi:DNA-binding PadR family transcriptional regulator
MSRKERVLSPSAARILEYFIADPTREAHGFEVIRATKVPSGTLYPALRQLAEERRVLVAEWEDRNPVEGLPPRRFYRLDPQRAPEASALLAEHRIHEAAKAASRRARSAEPQPA